MVTVREQVREVVVRVVLGLALDERHRDGEPAPVADQRRAGAQLDSFEVLLRFSVYNSLVSSCNTLTCDLYRLTHPQVHARHARELASCFGGRMSEHLAHQCRCGEPGKSPHGRPLSFPSSFLASPCFSSL